MVAKCKQAPIFLTARILEAQVLPEGSMSEFVLRNVNIRPIFACFMLGTCKHIECISRSISPKCGVVFLLGKGIDLNIKAIN